MAALEEAIIKRVLPHSIEAEQSVIGSMLIDNEAINVASELITGEDFYNKHGLDSSATVHELLKKRSKDFTVGLMTDKRMFRSVIPYWETENGKLTKLVLMPIEMSMDGNKSENGLPRRSYSPEIVEYLKEMCKPYGTKIKLEKDGLITCEW